MQSFNTASKFFHASESLEGWAGCKQFVADGATFSAQSEPLTEIDSVEGYCEWMAGTGNGPLQGCSYDLHTSAYDEANKTAIFFATFNAKHAADGGPVPPTQLETHSHYVYVLTMNDDNRVSHMTKIWNAPWALRELGWG